MTSRPVNWEQIEKVVFAALEREGKERLEFLDRELTDFPEIRKDVETLIKNESEAEEFFSSPAAIKFASFIEDNRSEARQGQQLGAYRIIRELGMGGMGAVFLAERTDGEFDQRVAVKLLRREFNTSEIRQRFDREKQIQAALVHPAIARMTDAGTTADGIPYLVMEYIEGEDIITYCRQRGLSLKERLKLFNRVCDAVAFAHRNLVIHRDLKPSNILVTEQGDPKLLDFGISKLLTEEFDDTHSVTRMGMMTPEYASPEQISREKVTTASDIYSLGVILYQLLTGETPFGKDRGRPGDILKAAVELDPERPSDVLAKRLRLTMPEAGGELPDPAGGESEDAATGSGKKERTRANLVRTRPQEPIQSGRLLRGDLDNIVLKALRKEADRRYSTVEQISEDVWRHLDGLPVSARPATLGYRTSKFVRRHKYSVITVGMVLLVIFAGMAATLWQAEIARREAEKARKMGEFMQSVLNFSNPSWTSSNPEQNRKATIADAMDAALENIDNDLAGEPEIKAEILFALGRSYVYQGRTEKAEGILRDAIDGFDQVLGIPNAKSMQASVVLADNLYLAGRLDEAEQLYDKTIGYFRPLVSRDPGQKKWLAIALNDLGNIYALKRGLEETEELYREALDLAEDLEGKDRYMLTPILGNMGRTMERRGRFDKAKSYYDRALAETHESGRETTIESGLLMRSIGQLHTAMADYEAAETDYAKAYEILIEHAGMQHSYTLSTMYNRAVNFHRNGKQEEAKRLVEKTLAIQRRLYPEGHYTTAFSLVLLGDILTVTGELQSGERYIREAVEYFSIKGKGPDQRLAMAESALGVNLVGQNRKEEAVPLLRSALRSFRATEEYEGYEMKRCREMLEKLGRY